MRPVLPAIFSSITVTLAFGSSPSFSQEYPEMSLKLAHFVPSNVTGSKVDKWFADEINKRSGGRIKIQIFWSESLGKANELLDLVASGAVDLAAVSPGYFPNKLPLAGATNSVMMQFPDNAAAAKITAEIVEKFPAVQDELKKANVYPIFFHSLNPYRLFCSRKVEKIEDFKGLKIRSWGEYIPVMWESLGATPVSLMTPDIYEGLQRGIVDCNFYANDLNYAIKLYEVAKYTWSGEEDHFGAIPTWPIWISWKTWHEWPENVRSLFKEVGQEAMQRDIELVKADEEKSLKIMVEKHKVKVVDFVDNEKVRATVPDLAKLWIDRMKERGLGKEAEEIAAFWKERTRQLGQK